MLVITAESLGNTVPVRISVFYVSFGKLCFHRALIMSTLFQSLHLQVLNVLFGLSPNMFFFSVFVVFYVRLEFLLLL